ncbi:hypothetical protein N7508_005323 [Penicillium antarcticum]|uniref:uncharacterized protein n=1 Tax=Penicillium antarcticum TaxID=416450 RepID=UPI0023875A96|nr:uncharacterized protein N7508_005323 [Penicillium antarcticum]KAJ5306308.1 hypothetical protein N7508_005323 [Penicillium antarcticum]
MCPSYSDEEYEHMEMSEMTARPISSRSLLPPRPGSLTSSEEFYRPNPQDYVPYFAESGVNSRGTTSRTSIEDTWINTHPNYVPIAPEPDHGVLEGIDIKYNPLEGDIPPQDLDDDLGIGAETNLGQPLDSFLPAQQPVPRQMLGMPDSVESMPLVPQPLQHAVHQVVISLNQVLGSAYNLDQISLGLEGLDVIKNFFETKIMPPPPPSTTPSRTPDRHKCPLCQPKPGLSKQGFAFGSFKRHLALHGIGQCGYPCPDPDCKKISRRRDRAQTHYQQSHGHYGKPADTPLTPVNFPFPSQCPVCHEKMSSWDAFWKHFKGHSIVRHGSAGPSTSGDSNRRDSDGNRNGGNANGPSHSSAAGPSNYLRQQPQSGNYLHPTSYPGNSMWPHDSTRQSHSVRRDQLSDESHYEGNPFTENPSAAPFNPGRPFSADLIRPSNGSPYFQSPGSSQADQSTKRKRKDKQPMNHDSSSPRKCKRCDHDLAKCTQCCYLVEPIRGCHKCSGDSAGCIPVPAPSPVPSHNIQGQSCTVIELDQNYYNYNSDLSFPNFGQGHEAQFMPYPFDTNMQNPGTQTQMQSFPSELDSFDGGSQSQSPFIGAAMIVPQHTLLRDPGSEVKEPYIFECDSKLLRMIGLDSFIGPLSKVQHESYTSEAPFAPLPTSLSDIVPKTKEPPAARKSPELISQCNCPCARLPLVQYQAHAGAKLSPLERVEMTFKMSPDDPQVSRSLRTRVQVFVKLFRIRSKVAEIRSKKTMRRLSIQPRTASNDGYEAGSDTDSAHEDSPASASDSETVTLIQWGEDVQEWCSSLDVGRIIGNLSQWASGMNTNMRSDIFYSDPAWILDFVSLYIMHEFISNFRMTW